MITGMSDTERQDEPQAGLIEEEASPVAEEASPDEPEQKVAEVEETTGEPVEEVPPTESDEEEAPEEQPLAAPGMKWYVLRVASNKEESVRDSLERKVKIEGLEEFIGRILVPTLKERRLKGGQAKIAERKLYPGYVFVEMAPEEDGRIPERVWFMIKETTGVGDFIGSDGKPISMLDHEVVSMLAASEKADEQPELSGLDFKKGDRVKISEGSFENFEGEVDLVDEHRGMVTVLLTIFGRATPVDVEYWQLEKL